MEVDLLCSLGVIGASLAVAVAYAGRVSRRGSAHDARIDRAGRSPLLGKSAMEMAYWAMHPVARGCIALGLSANAISWASLALAGAAGASLATGHFGVGAALSAVSSLGDALDGMVARETGTASDSGEVLDAAIDRYAELFFLGGVILYARLNPLTLLLALGATTGSVMVSYSTAKAEALGVVPPRGAMRRQERAVYFLLGAALVPIVAAAAHRWGLPSFVERLPLLVCLGLVAVVGNVSAVRRFRTIAAAVHRHGPAASPADGDARTLSRDAHVAASDAMR